MSEFWITTLLSILAMLLTAALAMLGYVISLARKREARWTEFDTRFDELEKQIKVLQTQVSPFWAALQTQIAEALHHPHPESKELDGLLEKLEALSLTHDERLELRSKLFSMVNDPLVTSEEKSKASALLIIMPLVVTERAALSRSN